LKVFVTGASGFVGEEILQHLQRAGHTIRILARNPKSDAVQKITTRFGAEVHPGNILDLTSLPAGLKGVDAVIHLVGIISEIGQNTFENIHALGTENIITAAKTASVKRVVHMSALGTRPNAVSRYHRSKLAAEDFVTVSGLDYTVFRPSIIYGPHDHFVNLFAKISRFSPILPVMGSGKSKMQPIPVADVATCFVKSLTEPKSIGKTFDLCGPEPLTFNQIIDTILQITDRERFELHIPMWLARRQAALLESVFPWLLGEAPPLNRDQLLMLAEDNVGDPQPANELFGLQPIPFKEGIARYLKH
jgi:NADH dehydrogenase